MNAGSMERLVMRLVGVALALVVGLTVATVIRDELRQITTAFESALHVPGQR